MKTLIVLLFAVYIHGYTNPDNMPTFKELCEGCNYLKICVLTDKKGCIIGDKKKNKLELTYDGELSITEFWREFLIEKGKESQ